MEAAGNFMQSLRSCHAEHIPAGMQNQGRDDQTGSYVQSAIYKRLIPLNEQDLLFSVAIYAEQSQEILSHRAGKIMSQLTFVDLTQKRLDNKKNLSRRPHETILKNDWIYANLQLSFKNFHHEDQLKEARPTRTETT
jgi:hypothetical protein